MKPNPTTDRRHVQLELEQLVEQVATLCGAPIAVIEGGGREPAASVGLGPFDATAMGTFAREIRSVASGTVFIADLTEHHRLADHAMVAGNPCARALVGACVYDEAGETIGTLFVLHTAGDALGEPHRLALEGIAVRAGSLLTRLAQIEGFGGSARERLDMVASLSHEIQTPALAVLGMADLLACTDLDVEQEQYVAIARNAAQAMVDGVEALLGLQDRGHAHDDIDAKPLPVRSFTESTVELVAYNAYEKGVGLAVEVADTLPDLCILDAHRLRQVLLAILDRAVEVTQRGHVEIAVEASKDGKCLMFSVRDGGPCLAPEELGRICAPEGEVALNPPEPAVDLDPARRIAERMDGLITAACATEGGTRVTLQLPLVSGDPQGEAADKRSKEDIDADLLARLRAIEPKRILLVEDATNNRFFVTAFLRGVPHEIVEATNGREAVEMVEAEGPFDLILMDMQMPEMDGYTATPIIRELEAAQGVPRVPIVALTGDTTEAERRRAFEVGCDEHMPKPVLRTTLLDAVARHLTAVDTRKRAIERATATVTATASDTGTATATASKPASADRLARAVAEARAEIATQRPSVVRDCRERLMQLMLASNDSDFESIVKLGVEIREAGEERGFRVLITLGAAIEEGGQRRDDASVRQAVGRLAMGLRSLQRFES